MSVFRVFSFSSSNVLGCRSLLCPRNSTKITEQHRTAITSKALEKLGIPLPPQKPLNPYLKYVQTFRPKVLQDQPNLPNKEIIKVLAQQWNNYDPDKKKELQKIYLSEMEVYLEKLEKYKETITPEQELLIEKAKQKRKHSKELAKINEKKESLGRPKRPSTAFIIYLKERIVQKEQNEKYADWLKKISQDWEQLPESIKDKYRETSKRELDKYKMDLLSWEEQMIRQGHIDVVRNRGILDTKSKKQSKKTT